jgi:L-alanine-DL-glutamate epimerase-like enolase superfamily enzyme
MTGPAGRPLRAGASVNDIMGSMFAAIAILAAVLVRITRKIARVDYNLTHRPLIPLFTALVAVLSAIAVILKVREAVGATMEIMVDPGCELRTWADALYVGRACDETACFWYEDPYRDASVSVQGQRMLREKLKTPLLVSEHIRGPEQKASFALAGGCDMIHADPEYDLGITGLMKIAHMAESIGMDIQIHACGPAHRACAAAIRNTHFYELALIGPGMPNLIPPVYTGGYSDQPEGLGRDGCLPVPAGPGLGVAYDWEFIRKNAIATHSVRL